ncbi:MAG: hypothetical protein ACFFC3_10275 [Candidatus Odinarchaeota archaeon]
MLSIELTKSKNDNEKIIRYKCPNNHILPKLFLSFYIYRSGFNYKLINNKHIQFGHYFRCPECNTSYYEDKWEVVDLDLDLDKNQFEFK